MMEIIGASIVVRRPGRLIPVARFTQLEYFTGLLAFHVLPSVAAAATRNIITITVKTH
jgi:hypothetical protein